MNKRLGALDAAFSQLNIETDTRSGQGAKARKKLDEPSVLKQRNSLADEVAGGRVKSASQRYVLPSQCRMWRRHNRIYGLLTAENCRELIEDIRGKAAQQTPAIARPLKEDPDGFEYEIIAGARRHFAVNYLREKEGMTDLFYFIEVKRMSDAEAFLISDAENRGRKDISDFERALDYASALEEFYGGNAKRMSDKIGMPRSSLRHYLNLANLPGEVVEAFSAPTDISLRNASKIIPVLNDETKRDPVLEKAIQLRAAQKRAQELGQARAYEASQVIGELLAAGDAPKRKKVGKNTISTIESDRGAKLFELERGRKYVTVRIPLEQLNNAPELMKKLKREITKTT